MSASPARKPTRADTTPGSVSNGCFGISSNVYPVPSQDSQKYRQTMRRERKFWVMLTFCMISVIGFWGVVLSYFVSLFR